jgi:hypothetical protein
MPRITEKETDKHRLWETIFFLKGEEYLNEKLKYLHNRVQEEEISLVVESVAPVKEYKDSNFYENQISQYEESIRIINSIIKNNSKKNIFSIIFIKKLILKQFHKIIKLDPKNGSIKKTDPSAIDRNNIIGQNDSIINEQKIRNTDGKTHNTKSNRKIKINLIGLLKVTSVLLTMTIASALIFDSPLFISIFGCLTLLLLIPLLLTVIEEKRISNIKTGKYMMEMLANKLGGSYNGRKINGYFNGHRLEIIQEKEKKLSSIKIQFSAITFKNMIAYFTYHEITIQGLKKISTESMNFNKKIMVFSNCEKIKSILDKPLQNVLLNFQKKNRNFEFVLHDNNLCFFRYNSRIKNWNDVAFYLKVLELFNIISTRLERL